MENLISTASLINTLRTFAAQRRSLSLSLRLINAASGVANGKCLQSGCEIICKSALQRRRYQHHPVRLSELFNATQRKLLWIFLNAARSA